MRVAVYCGSNMGDKPGYIEVARQMGQWLADRGHSLVYGGSAVGLMGIISKTVFEAGGEVIGVEPKFFIDAGVEQHDITELVLVESMSERKAVMIERADAFVALPGGVGTLEEIVEIMSRIRLRLTKAPCVIVNVDGFYDPLRVLLDNMADAGFLARDERDSVVFMNSVDEAGAYLEEWTTEHALADVPLKNFG